MLYIQQTTCLSVVHLSDVSMGTGHAGSFYTWLLSPVNTLCLTKEAVALILRWTIYDLTALYAFFQLTMNYYFSLRVRTSLQNITLS